jgi:membrane fusion protein (multidrug efflux system)
VKALIANADGRLRPGLFARADLGVARREGALLVPEEAVLQRADGEVVFVVTPEDTARRVLVKTGLQREGKVEIVEGVAAQDQVVVRGHAVLVDGVPVTRRPPNVGGDEQSLNAAAERGGERGAL